MLGYKSFTPPRRRGGGFTDVPLPLARLRCWPHNERVGALRGRHRATTYETSQRHVPRAKGTAEPRSAR
eukprot:3595992-Prymnesium_polylepis.1